MIAESHLNPFLLCHMYPLPSDLYQVIGYSVGEAVCMSSCCILRNMCPSYFSICSYSSYPAGGVLCYLWPVNSSFIRLLYRHVHFGPNVHAFYCDKIVNSFAVLRKLFCMFLFPKIKDIVFKSGLWSLESCRSG